MRFVLKPTIITPSIFPTRQDQKTDATGAEDILRSESMDGNLCLCMLRLHLLSSFQSPSYAPGLLVTLRFLNRNMGGWSGEGSMARQHCDVLGMTMCPDCIRTRARNDHFRKCKYGWNSILMAFRPVNRLIICYTNTVRLFRKEW